MLETIIPPRLRAGAAIGIVAPASPPSSPEKIAKGIAYLEQKGFRLVLGESLSRQMGYLSGSDECRANDINNMFADFAVDAIFCSRGGYGSSRILDRLDYPLIKRSPKIFVGYSDVTALSMAFLRKAGLVTFAGPMVAADMQSGIDETTETSFWSLISSRRKRTRIEFETTSHEICSFQGSAEGHLIGGTLSILVTLLGTPFEPPWKNGILFLEDVGENVYKIDRMLGHLRHAGVLGRLNGIILGSFTAIPEDKPNRDLKDVFTEYLGSLKIPVMSGFPFGHTMPKLTLPFGAKIRMDTGKNKLWIQQAVVS